MNPNSNQLALRDPALAALLGVLPESNFGSEHDDYAGFGAEFGAEFAAEFAGPGYGSTNYGRGSFNPFGDDSSAGLAAMHPAAVVQQAQQIVQQATQAAAHTRNRGMILEPNAGSSIKVERYTFSLNQTLTLGTVVAINASQNPDTTLRPQQVTCNAPAPGFATFSEIKLSNVSVTVGGTADAWQFNANGVGRHLDCPTLSPANRALMLGNYSGYVPPGYAAASPYIFCLSFTGPASIVA